MTTNSLAGVPQDPDYLTAVQDFASRYGVHPSTLFRMAKGESGFDPAAQTGSYMGLYQIHKNDLKSMGIEPQQYLGMTRAQQLGVFGRYLDSVGYKPGDGDDQLMLTLPFGSRSVRQKPEDHVVFPVGSEEWRRNPGWHSPGGGPVTVGSALAYYKKQLGGQAPGSTPSAPPEPDVLAGLPGSSEPDVLAGLSGVHPLLGAITAGGSAIGTSDASDHTPLNPFGVNREVISTMKDPLGTKAPGEKLTNPFGGYSITGTPLVPANNPPKKGFVKERAETDPMANTFTGAVPASQPSVFDAIAHVGQIVDVALHGVQRNVPNPLGDDFVPNPLRPFDPHQFDTSSDDDPQMALGAQRSLQQRQRDLQDFGPGIGGLLKKYGSLVPNLISMVGSSATDAIGQGAGLGEPGWFANNPSAVANQSKWMNLASAFLPGVGGLQVASGLTGLAGEGIQDPGKALSGLWDSVNVGESDLPLEERAFRGANLLALVVGGLHAKGRYIDEPSMARELVKRFGDDGLTYDQALGAVRNVKRQIFADHADNGVTGWAGALRDFVSPDRIRSEVRARGDIFENYLRDGFSYEPVASGPSFGSGRGAKVDSPHPNGPQPLERYTGGTRVFNSGGGDQPPPGAEPPHQPTVEPSNEALPAKEGFSNSVPAPVEPGWFHGSSSPIQLGSTFERPQDQNLYGPGLYLTDNPGVAANYTKKGRGTEPSVYRAIVKGGDEPNLIDLDKPLPPDALKVFADHIPNFEEGDIEPGMLGRDVYELIKEAMEDDGYTRSDADEHLSDLVAGLQQKGYEGFSHKGGTIVGKTPHNVRIIWGDYMDGKVPAELSLEPSRDYSQTHPQAPPPPKFIAVNASGKNPDDLFYEGFVHLSGDLWGAEDAPWSRAAIDRLGATIDPKATQVWTAFNNRNQFAFPSDKHINWHRMPAKVAPGAPYGSPQPGAPPTVPSATSHPLHNVNRPELPQGSSFSALSSEGRPFAEERMRPEDIGVYPGLQYKRAGISDLTNAVTDDLKGVHAYDQATGGPLTVWQTSDGKRWVMNGHHRRELAIRTGEKSVPVRVFKEADGITFDDARALGAMQNLRDGKGTAIDAATVLRSLNAPPEVLRQYGLSTRSGVARDAMSLLKLSGDSLRMVEDGLVPEGVASGIADANLEPRRELAALKEAAKGNLETRNQGALLAEEARTAPMAVKVDEGDLFGGFEEGLALAQRAKIADGVLKRLAQNKQLYNAMVRGQAVGATVVDTEAQTNAAAVQEFARKVLSTDGEVANLLDEEAKTYAEKETPAQLTASINRIIPAAERAAARRLSELGQRHDVDASPRAGGGSTTEPGPEEGGPLLDVPPELTLEAPEAPKPAPKVDPTASPSQPSLDPVNLGEANGQMGMDMSRPANSPSSPKTPKSSGPTQAPTTPTQRTAAAALGDAIRALFDHRSEPTERQIGQTGIRQAEAAIFHDKVVATKALDHWRGAFIRRGWDASLDFVDRMENGQNQLTHEDQHAADAIREVLNYWSENLNKSGILDTFIQDYFPHIWAQAEGPLGSVAAKFFGKKPLRGSQAFKKHRSIPTIKEGIDAGLTPMFDNPIDMVLAKVGEMSRAYQMKMYLDDLRERGIAIKSDSEGDARANGRGIVPDPMFTIYGPPHVDVLEQYDVKATEALQTVMDSLGIEHSKADAFASEPGALGVHQGGNVMTRKFTREDVLSHEIGHALDTRLDLGKYLETALGKTWEQESSDLAEQRHDDKATDSFKEYVQEPRERVANLVHASAFAPEMAERLAPESMKALREFAKQHPEIQPLLDIKPSLMIGARKTQVPVPGRRIMGFWSVPDDLAKDLSRFLSPRIANTIEKPLGRGLLSTYTAVNSMMNMCDLSFSYFHGIFTTLETVGDELGNAVGHLSRGNVGGALKTAVRAPASPILNFIMGGKIRQAYERGTLSPDLARYVELAIQGGMRPAMSGFGPETHVGKLVDAWRRGQPLGVAGHALPSVLEGFMYPILGSWVPRLKLAAAMREATQRIEAWGPNITPERIGQIASEASDVTDENLGQVAYDNLFMHRWMREGMQLTMRAFGWTLGNLKGATKGAFVDPFTKTNTVEGLPPRTSKLIGRILATIGIGAVVHRMLTGKNPDSLLDCIHPQTGKKNADGTNQRLSLPSYVTDYEAWLHNPIQTAAHKLSPGVAALAESIDNKDYFGHSIRNEDDPLIAQVGQEGAFILRQFLPFTFQQSTGKEGIGPMGMLGIKRAANWITQSPAMQRANEYIRESIPPGERTSAQEARSSFAQDVMRLAYNGDIQGAMKMVSSDPTISKKTLQELTERIAEVEQGVPAIVDKARKLPIDQLLHIYDLADDHERKAILEAPASATGKNGENLISHKFQLDQEHGTGRLTNHILAQALANHPELRDYLPPSIEGR